MMVASMATLTGAWVVLGNLSDGYRLWDIVVDRYSAVHQPISGLGLGTTGNWMNAAFVASGLCSVAGAVGIGRSVSHEDPRLGRQAAAWLVLPGAGSILCGLFTLEQMPLHSLGFLLVISPIAGYAILGRRLRRLRGWEVAGRLLANVAAPVLAALTAGFFATFNPERAGANQGVAGLAQRLLVLALQSSLIALAYQAQRQRTASTSEPTITPSWTAAEP